MLIVIILGVILATLLADMPSPLGAWLTAGRSAAGVVGVIALVVAVSAANTWRTLRLLKRWSLPFHRVLRSHHRRSFLMRGVLLSALTCQVWIFGWGRFVAQLVDPERFFSIAVVLLVLPLLVEALCCLAIGFIAQRRLRERAAENRRVYALPVGAPWAFKRFLTFHIRCTLLTAILLLAALAACRDAAVWIWPYLNEFRFGVWIFSALAGAAGVALLTAYPLGLRLLWGLRRLEAGPIRTRLEGLANRAGIACPHLLVWPTGGVMVNAAVIGFVRPTRYMILTDALLDALAPEEIEAVFGHESAHVRFHHLQYYLLFALSVAALLGVISNSLYYWGLSAWGAEVYMVLFMLLAWGGVFGWISRRFERQADLYAAMLLGDAGNESAGRIFAAALTKVALAGGASPKARSWRHASINSRIEAVHTLLTDSDRRRAFLRTIRWIKAALCGGFFTAAVIAAYAFLLG